MIRTSHARVSGVLPGGADPTAAGEHDAELLQRILDASSAALDALERGDDLGLAAALDERERLQAAAAPVLARAARQLRRGGESLPAEGVIIREMALEMGFWNRVLERRMLRRRDERTSLAQRAGRLGLSPFGVPREAAG